jgi:hypothetical protein
MDILEAVLEKSPDFAKQLSKRLVSDHVYIPIFDNQFIRVPVCGLNEEKLGFW